MNGLEYIKSKQHSWANRKKIELLGATIPNKGEKNYLEKLADNLFQPLTRETLSQFNNGDGNEIADSKSRLAKMKALHSSSAIVVNLFQYWNDKDVYPIIFACKLCSKQPSGVDVMYENTGSNNPKIFSASRNPLANKIKFEGKFKISSDTKTFPFPPNIDIVIGSFQPIIYAIESKFSEPYSGKPKGISQKYLDNTLFWNGLPELYNLAKEISPDNNKFKYLDAAQLLKHILGLKTNHSKSGFRLLYLWYDVLGQDGVEHRNEIEQFAKVAKKDNIKFSHITYQEVIIKLSNNFYSENKNYCDYLTDRYL